METMTIRQVLEITIQNLRGITLPVALMETVGQALVGSIRNLEACVNAIDNAERGAEDGTDPDSE
jgi:hypothetical protein